MAQIPFMKEMPKECPWCHQIPAVEEVPLWHGSHGYHGNYEYYVGCKNERCKVRPRTTAYNDIYHGDKQKCIDACIKDWNDR